MKCYIDGLPCDCNPMSEIDGECPRDPYQHEDDPDLQYETDLVDEEMIDDGYYAQQKQSEEECYDRF